MFQTAEIAGNARQCRCDDVLVERGEREYEHQSGEYAPQLAGRNFLTCCSLDFLQGLPLQQTPH
jgi:hypothetical protein